MPKFIASYDLQSTYPDPHSTFLEKAKERGWDLWVQADSGKWYRLPNTTLLGTFDSRDAAAAALKAARSDTASELGTCVMEKWIVAGYSGSTFDSDVTTN